MDLDRSMIEASAPAKAILFGEHAVVYGKPAIAAALDMRIRLRVRSSGASLVDGRGLKTRRNRYFRWALENLWDGGPLEITTSSEIPSASGLGSSAAVCTSLDAAFQMMRGVFDEEECARDSFEVEYNVQGSASPTDTSCSTHGKGILVSFEKGREDHLWSISKNDRTWHIHHLDIPRLTLVVGFTGRPSVTPVQVGKVAQYCGRSGFARETIDEIGELVLEGRRSLERGDKVEIGELMNKNHSLLSILGVNSKELQKLKDAADPHSYGVKLTGAGGGGSIIALTDRPREVAEAIERRGGAPFCVRVAEEGAGAVRYEG